MTSTKPLQVRIPKSRVRGLHPASKEYCVIVRDAIVAKLTKDGKPRTEAEEFARRWYADHVCNLRHPDIDRMSMY